MSENYYDKIEIKHLREIVKEKNDLLLKALNELQALKDMIGSGTTSIPASVALGTLMQSKHLMVD